MKLIDLRAARWTLQIDAGIAALATAIREALEHHTSRSSDHGNAHH